VAVRIGIGAVPEVMTPGGRPLLGRSPTILFLVDVPESRGPACILMVMPPDDAKILPHLKPLKSSASGLLRMQARTSSGKQVFSRPGSYTVRAVAGRLVSNPVTVIVEQKAPAAGRAPAPRRKAAPARGAGAGPVRSGNPARDPMVEAIAVLKSSEKMLKMLRKLAYDGKSSKLFAEYCVRLRQMSARLRGLGRIGEADAVNARLEKIVRLRKLGKPKRPEPPPSEVF
jgi:hypothetical protein